MGRLALVARLAARDLRYRPSEAILLLLAITAAATTLTLGLVLHGVTSGPYERTRAATAGPDLVATVSPAKGSSQPGVRANLLALAKAPGVTASSGPYPVTLAALRGGGYTAPAMVEGRAEAPSAVDRPLLTAGSWVRPGTVVLERSFAAALGVEVGNKITLNGRWFLVSGIAVSAAVPPYPGACLIGCYFTPSVPPGQPGLVWTTQQAAESLASSEPLVWLMNLRLADPAGATSYANSYNATQRAHTALSAPYLVSWQQIAAQAGLVVSDEQQVLLVASWLLCLLAVASVAVLAGGRMVGQVRRVGLLKAVGATPGLVAAVLLAEHLVLALAAAAIGLALGWLAASLLTSPGAGLLGSAGPPSMTVSGAGLVVAVALLVAVAATAAPAIRGARASTVGALAEVARPPRRRPLITRCSALLPVPLLLGTRIAARRPRRTLLSAVSVVVTVAGVVAALTVHARFDSSFGAGGGLVNPLFTRISQVMSVLTVALLVLSAVNALLITWATTLDARRQAALAHALGATAGQLSAGLAVAQMLPALAGAIAGIPAGLLLYAAVRTGGPMTYPPAWWLACVVIATPLAAGALTVVPSRLAARTGVGPVLQSEAALWDVSFLPAGLPPATCGTGPRRRCCCSSRSPPRPRH
ncbi:FtsX-like permease family protein [Trebonia sp.]|uniref:ABC transporter permease n=1 Tax=Trebonia sp. TaxID=2767075 RepID=UPI002626D1CD|nr:FtsX-like permease family protein [Trebonia sp.]